MFEKGLVITGGTALLVAAIFWGIDGKPLIASGCALAALVVFWCWKYTPQNDNRKPTTANNPTPQEVRQYRKDNPGISITHAVRSLKGQN